METRKKNILQIIPSLKSGGIERGVVEINNYLVKNGFNSFVLSSGGKMVYQIDVKFVINWLDNEISRRVY